MATYLGLHHTLEEVQGWYTRAMTGSYPGWTRITTNKASWLGNKGADRFNDVYKGALNSPVPVLSPPPRVAAEKLRDAALYYLIMSHSQHANLTTRASEVAAGNAGKRLIIDEILNNIIDATYKYGTATIKTFDWLGTPGRWPLRGGSDVSPFFELPQWHTRILYAWDYVKDQATDTEKAKFNAWIKGAATVVESYYKTTIDDLFASRTGTPGTYSIKASLAAEELSGVNSKGEASPYLHSGYKRAHKVGRIYGNRRRDQWVFVGLVGTFIGNQAFIDSATRIFKEYFAYGVYPDLSYCDFLRSHDRESDGTTKASHGYSYSIPVPVVVYADCRARVGDTSLYDYETTLGTTTLQSGTGNSSDGSSVKGLLRHMKLLNQMHSPGVGSVNRYSPNDGTSRIGAVDNNGKENTQYMIYRMANLYYQDTTLNTFITRTDPPSNTQQPNGPANPYTVGHFSDITLMYSGYGNVPTLNRYPSLETDPDVPKVPQVISVIDPPDRAYQPGETFAITATAPGGAVTITKVSGPGTLVGNVVTVTGAGTFAFKFNQAGNDTYLPAPETTTHVVIRKADQTLFFNAIPDQEMPGSVNIVFGSDSGLTPIATSDNANLTKSDADTFALADDGLGSITITQAGDANYNAAVPITRTFTIAPADEPTGNVVLLTEGRDANGDLYPVQPTTVSQRITVGGASYFRWTTTWAAFGVPKFLSGLLMKTGRQTGQLVFNNRLKSYRYEVRLVGAGPSEWTLWCYDNVTQKNDIDRGLTINNVIQVRRIVDKQDPRIKIQETQIYGHTA